jgi:hypothetical protein
MIGLYALLWMGWVCWLAVDAAVKFLEMTQSCCLGSVGFGSADAGQASAALCFGGCCCQTELNPKNPTQLRQFFTEAAFFQLARSSYGAVVVAAFHGDTANGFFAVYGTEGGPWPVQL